MDQQEPSRTRTFSWEDPTIALRQGKNMSGFEYLKAIQAGELPPPPISPLLDMQITEVKEGRVTFALEPAEYQYNPLGSVHGGVLASLLDSSLGCAVQSLLPAGTGYTTIELKINYVRAVTHTTGMIYSEGTVIHMGGRIATAEARATDKAGKLYAHATTTCLIMRPERSKPSS
ncbi:phenylacetic acid degradation protein [Dictyobacter alpinus]|uniref:Phenylacetic acid degradation protein n=1 Tax=Dictyobacter alpinus TaxID=2014873 RepID=A0A402BHK2_9CHLR|nr:PaaI family thioesterase [Dictyobacter alpinus]GCE30898.1 phenylacetic acid degradation protein [Dictyobacter alpinus]